MAGSSVNADQTIAELVDMGFNFSQVIEAINAVGPSVDAAIEFLFDDSRKNAMITSCSSDCLTEKGNGKRVLSSLNPSRPMKQLKLFESIKTKSDAKANTEVVVYQSDSFSLDTASIDLSSYRIEEEENIGQDWELKVENLMQKHFGFSSLKSFQKEALAAWIAHQDCLVLAATGSGECVYVCLFHLVIACL